MNQLLNHFSLADIIIEILQCHKKFNLSSLTANEIQQQIQSIFQLQSLPEQEKQQLTKQIIIHLNIMTLSPNSNVKKIQIDNEFKYYIIQQYSSPINSIVQFHYMSPKQKKDYMVILLDKMLKESSYNNTITQTLRKLFNELIA